VARIDSTQDAILKAVVDRLREILQLSKALCYETLEPLVDPPIPKGGEYFLTVSPGDSVFDEALQAGGGRFQLTEMGSVTVTAYAKIRLDAGDRVTEVLHTVGRGMMPIKLRILDALVGHDLADAAGDLLLRHPIYAMRSWRPQYNAESGIARVAVGFGTDFDWDMSTELD
jgi:hypothetical protein